MPEGPDDSLGLEGLKGLEGLEPLSDLLARHGLDGAVEKPFPNDGWSGASLTRLRSRAGETFILKRNSPDRDWIARATRDGPLLREAWFAAHGPELPAGIRAGYLGAGWGTTSDEVGILMPDLSDILFDWDVPISMEALDRVLDGLAAMSSIDWSASGPIDGGPWCPLRERLTLISRPSLERPGPARDAVAERLLPGWDAWDRMASPSARTVIADLAADPQPLLDALAGQPVSLIHGDLKLANAGVEAGGSVVLVDWQMTMFAPVAVELGWFLVANVATLPLPPDEVIRLFQSKLALVTSHAERRERGFDRPPFDENGVDAAILVGLLLRGWRKGADAAAGATLASRMTAADDLAWWCERAIAATRSLR